MLAGVREYNLFAVFRLHSDVAGLQRFADSIVAIPRLRVRLSWLSYSAAEEPMARDFTGAVCV